MDAQALKRVTVFAGHYGSGKTNVAVNYALRLCKNGIAHVAIADLDIVNPYFRTKDAAKALEDHGVRLISSAYANTNVDTPALPADAYAVVHDRSLHAVLDVGGDDRGALALGRYAPYLSEEQDYEMLLVVNKYRYLTKEPAEALTVMREIEEAAGLRFTGVVNNSNLGDETTVGTVLDSIPYAKAITDMSGLPLRFTTVRCDLYDALKDQVEHPLPLTLYVRQSFKSR